MIVKSMKLKLYTRAFIATDTRAFIAMDIT